MSLEDAPEDRLLEELLPKRFIMFAYNFQATIPRNSFGNGALSKEIEIYGFESKNTRERAMVNFFKVGDDVV